MGRMLRGQMTGTVPAPTSVSEASEGTPMKLRNGRPANDSVVEGVTDCGPGTAPSSPLHQDRRPYSLRKPRTSKTRLDADTFEALWRSTLRKVSEKGRSRT